MTVKKKVEWNNMVEGISNVLAVFRHSHACVYLDKTQGAQCEDLNYQVFSRFREKGCDARRPLSIQHTNPHRNFKGSLTSTGRIVFPNQDQLQQEHLLATSRMLYGVLSGVPLHAGVISYVRSKHPAQNSGAQLGPKFPVPISSPNPAQTSGPWPWPK